MNATPEQIDVTENALLNGRVRLRQPARGYRAGMDAALLAAACPALPGERVMEAGCGAGAVLMQIAARRPGVALAGLERDADMAGLAQDNAGLNSWADRITVHQGEVAAGFRGAGARALRLGREQSALLRRPRRLRAPAPASAAPGWPTTVWRPGPASCSRP